MGPFPILNPYPEDGLARGQPSTQDATESDSDNEEIEHAESDPDFLSLMAAIELTETTKTQRNLAAATIEFQKRHSNLWKRYCTRIRQPVDLLENCDAKFFKGYLMWYQTQYTETAKRLSTFETMWKGIRQLYYDTYGRKVDDTVGKDVAKFLNGPFCDERGLIRGNRPKYTVGYNGILGALYYHWIYDTETFPTGRDRVQLAFYILLLAYTGSRPGAIVESAVSGIRGTNEALKYKDINLTLVRPNDGGAPLLVMKVRIVLDKGKRHRGEHKTLTLYENCVQPVMCPVVHFLALAFADKAFHPSLVEAGLSDILETPILRPASRGFAGKEVDPSKALSASIIGPWMARLGERAGFPHRLTPYCLRRDIATSLTDVGVSQPQLLQILGHRKIDTYQRHYQSTNVIVDVQATFLGSTSKSDMIKEIGKLCLRQDPNLPCSLTEEQKVQAHTQPDLQKLEHRREGLTRELKAQFRRLKDGASTPLFLERRRVMGQLSHGRARAEKEYFQRILREFHDTADLNHMVSQLQGKNNLVGTRPPVDFAFEERQRLATTLFQETTESNFAQIVEDLCLLCTRQEQSRSGRVSYSPTPTAEHSLDMSTIAQGSGTNVQENGRDITVVESSSLPILDITQPSPHLNILEDIVVESSLLPITSTMRDAKHGRAKPFARPATLRKHYENIHFQYQVGCFYCPVPGCAKLIEERKMFANHAVRVHKNDIGVRATLRESIGRGNKRGGLLPFTL
ncbi:MAG: hypothetical protein Q9168_001719 [Polycauliona sp. 1 TL-2023]